MKGPGPISIKHIGLAFVTGLLVLVSLIGGFSAYQTRALTHNLAQHNHDAARSELAAAVQRLLSQTEDLAIQLAEWDETRQQLVLPEYYPYWRDQRVYESGILSSRLLRVALYTQAGALLEPGTAYRYAIDMVGTAVVFQPGHRIRVDITSSNFPQFDRNLNTGDPLGKGTQPRVAQQTIWHSAARPSAVVLPVVPGF